MAAVTSTIDQILRKHYAPLVAKQLEHRSLLSATPEWWAWAKEWREEIPLTPEQKAENAAWRATLPKAREELSRIRDEYDEAIEAIQDRYGVSVTRTMDDDFEIDEIYSHPPHLPGRRTRDGAPPEPPKWPEPKGRRIEWRRK